MKPWSEASQEALKMLLEFYSKRKTVLGYCPLCLAAGALTTRNFSVCDDCPWGVMTKNPCFNSLNIPLLGMLPETLRYHVNNFVELGEELTEEDLKAINKRVNQLEEWIQYYDNFKEDV